MTSLVTYGSNVCHVNAYEQIKAVWNHVASFTINTVNRGKQSVFVK